MEEKRTFAVQSLLLIVLFNAVLLVVVYLIGGEALAGQALVVFGIGGLITLLLWFLIQQLGRRLMEGAAAARPAAAEPARLPQQDVKREPAPASEASAIQVLSILQRRGRFIDFLQEDLGPYSDAQIGAAVRNIHEGCKQALAEYVRLEPIFKEEEGSEVTLQPGFDARAVRLIGDVAGDPPFKGALRHRGWRVVSVDLPARMQDREKDMILTAAEVEVQA